MKFSLSIGMFRLLARRVLPVLSSVMHVGGIRFYTVFVLSSALLASLTPLAFGQQRVARLLDGFDDVNAWRVSSSDDVDASLHPERGALRLDFDFNGVSGFASLRRELPLSFNGNFALSLRVRGDSPANALQVKLIDASGDNVWWINRPDFTFSRNWQTVRAERRRIKFAWGPAEDHTLRRTAAVEIVVAAGDGGRGHVCFDDLKLEPLPQTPKTWPVPAVRASSSAPPGAAASPAMDGDITTAWLSDPAGGPRQTLDLDFGVPRPFGGLVLHWLPGLEATRYAVKFSDDGSNWRTVRCVTDGNGGEDPLLLTDSRTRYVRLAMEEGPAHAYGLSEVEVKDLSWGATPNGFFERLANTVRRGLFPRGFSGEQSYWTIVGVDGGGANSALISEDGAVELGRGGFSVEPFLIAGGRLLTWADVSSSQELDDGYLPIPGVAWKAPGLGLHIEAFAAGDRENSRLMTRYTVENQTGDAQNVTLALAVRPFQVNPPTQFLNTPGGVSPIHKLAWNCGSLKVDGTPRLFPLQTPDSFVAGSFDSGDVVVRLGAGEHAAASRVIDDFGYASGAMLFRMELPAHDRRTVDLLAPLSGAVHVPDAARQDPDGWTVQERDAAAARWRAKLNDVVLHLPESAQAIGNTLRTSLAYILISRDGPALQPGTRSYARSWIRDGAMMSEGLLRMGRADVVRDFIVWYAAHQFSSGKTPCCVDARGSDPVPENDSHGELVFTVAELYRFTHDSAVLEALWPHVVRAIDYMERLSAGDRSPANRAPERPANYGLMPASISHEGYAAKPVHSYWDDFWALKGYEDAVVLARILGKSDEAERIAEARDRFRALLNASICVSVKRHAIDYLPGSVELGDFDATSTTVALSPGGELARLPRDLLRNTFERYWRKFIARRNGKAGWDDYTPYELRTVAAFTRLGRRNRVQALLDFFLAHRRPAAWNGWAEVVHRDMRKPGFVGDMPHAWIASDFIRSVLDLLAYRRFRDNAMVLAAGIPTEWLKGDGVGISGLHTPWGLLSYRLHRENDRLHLHVDADTLPSGGLVLAWPYAGVPGEARINGRPASWRNGELHIEAAHADVTIKKPGTGPYRVAGEG